MQPGQFQPRGEDALIRRLQDLERRVAQNEAADPFGPMGIKPLAGGFDVTGTLGLPSGIIPTDALSDPLVISTAGVSQNNFAVSTAGDVFATATVTIPAGYSRADIQCSVVAGAINDTANPDYLYVASSINAVGGTETPQAAASGGGYCAAPANGIRSLTGLSGGTITVGCSIRAGSAGWSMNASNFANMTAVVFFRR